MSVVRDMKPLHDRLLQEWDRYKKRESESAALDECGKLLDQLKIKLTQAQFSFLPTQGPSTESGEVTYARDILEIGALWSIHKKDVDSFERYMSQLKCYYLDYLPSGIKESTYRNQLLGLNLLRLLSQNKLADFHTELELLPAEIRQSDQYIKHPVNIEQYLMEGSYNKVFTASGSIPAKEYSFFMTHLLHTIRDEIASCIEKAYERISLSEALRVLNFKLGEEKQMLAYVEQRKWLLNKTDGMFHFEREKKADDIIPSFDLAQQAIDYARELEMIV